MPFTDTHGGDVRPSQTLRDLLGDNLKLSLRINRDYISRLPFQTSDGRTLNAEATLIPGAKAVFVGIRITPESWHLYSFDFEQKGSFNAENPTDVEWLTGEITKQEATPAYREPISDSDVNNQAEIIIQTAKVLHRRSAAA